MITYCPCKQDVSAQEWIELRIDIADIFLNYSDLNCSVKSEESFQKGEFVGDPVFTFQIYLKVPMCNAMLIVTRYGCRLNRTAFIVQFCTH